MGAARRSEQPLEYAVTQHKVTDIVLMEHDECGGIAPTGDAIVAEHDADATATFVHTFVSLRLANMDSFHSGAER